MNDQALVDGFDVNELTTEFLEDPFPTYRALRELDPIHRNKDGSYFLTRYADLELAYKHPAMSSDKKVDFKKTMGDGPLYLHHTTSLVFNDDPYHARVRKLLAGAFTPRKLAELEPIIERVIDNLVGELRGRETFDLMDDFALVLPTEIIADMLGVDERTKPLLRDYSLTVLGGLETALTDEAREAGDKAVAEFGAYLQDLIDHRRKNPDEGGRGEVLAALIFGEVDGEVLSDVELVHNCIFLLNAGHETTANLTANAICCLMDNPEQMRRLRDDPGLIGTAVDETLRYDSSVQLGNRKLTEDVDMNGTMIPKDAYLHLAIGAANRDPAKFSDPEKFDIGRTPNPHLAFGWGKHICLGATLGRIEGRHAVGKFIQGFGTIEPAGERERVLRARFRGYRHVPVRVD